MALLDSFKKKEDGSSGQKTVPLETVISMKNQGYTNDQIFQSLSQQGFEQGSIFDALNQADVKMTMDYQQPQQQSYPDVSFDRAYASEMNKEKIEEVAEAIIDEKWGEFAQNLDKIVKWKEKTDSRLVEIEEGIKHLKEDFEKVHMSVLAKVGEYDSHITNVGASLKAMEAAFTKVLPSFVENVSELGRITNAMRGMQPAKKADSPKK